MNKQRYREVFKQMFWDVWPKMVLGQAAAAVLAMLVATPKPSFVILHIGFAIGILVMALVMSHLIAS